MYKELGEILVTAEQIQRRTKELGKEISQVYQDEEIYVISIINGAIIFTSDLVRTISNPVWLDCIRVSSYFNSTTSEQEPRVIDDFRVDLAGRHVLIIDDILDTGKTISKVTGFYPENGAGQPPLLHVLEKKGTRAVPYTADFIGFTIPNKFVVGYGLDFAGRYRNLPVIGVLKPELQNPPEWR